MARGLIIATMTIAFVGILVGALGTQLCKLGDQGSHSTCYVEMFCITGGFIGFPVGALIGRQFPKHAQPREGAGP